MSESRTDKPRRQWRPGSERPVPQDQEQTS